MKSRNPVFEVMPSALWKGYKQSREKLFGALAVMVNVYSSDLVVAMEKLNTLAAENPNGVNQVMSDPTTFDRFLYPHGNNRGVNYRVIQSLILLVYEACLIVLPIMNAEATKLVWSRGMRQMIRYSKLLSINIPYLSMPITIQLLLSTLIHFQMLLSTLIQF